jgi:hypothetical protein
MGEVSFVGELVCSRKTLLYRFHIAMTRASTIDDEMPASAYRYAISGSFSHGASLVVQAHLTPLLQKRSYASPSVPWQLGSDVRASRRE